MTPERWRRVEEVFHRAAERAPEDRAAFLDEACGGDPELRREVESLLDRNSSTEPEAQPEGETRTERGSTEPGPIVGTAGYMSPEQAAGKKVDASSDIFSFGALLYEMLTGRRAFRRDTPALTGKVSTKGAVARVTGGICVSPDDGYVLWGQLDRDTTDLMLIENFR